jgi:peptidoglycan/xylan/chitin deacetylase (PgdA/CDA1 family)
MPIRDKVISYILNMLAPSGPSSRLSVLIFHRVPAVRDPLFPSEPDAVEFEAKLALVKRWFNVLPLEEAVRRLAAGTLPSRALAISFDDGYADNYHVAAPILRDLGLSATFFISTAFLDGGRMWNDTLVEVIRNFRGDSLDLTPLGLGCHAMASIEERRASMYKLLYGMRHMPREEREAKVRQLAAFSGVALPDDLMMTSEDVRGMLRMGMGIGSHTHNHPILACESDDGALDEIVRGKAVLEGITGGPVALFAYPNGKPVDDYRTVHVDMVREAGFIGAVSTAWGVAGSGCDPFQIPRFTPWHRQPLRFGLGIMENLVRRRDFNVA